MKEFVILGYGAAGFAALIQANELGVKPVLIGYGPLGGTCVNVGCIPSKRLLRIAEMYSTTVRLHQFEEFNTRPDYESAFLDSRKIVETLRKEKYENLLSKYDVEVVEGKAHFISTHSVKVNGKIIEGKKFVIATGSSPYVPPIDGLREAGFWTNVEALNPDRKINSLAVIGGRAQALEFSQIYKRLGVDVVILQRSKVLLPDWEPEISLEAQKVLEDDGVYVVTNVKIKKVEREEGVKRIITDKGDVEVDEILVATGRKPNIDLNLEVAGVHLNEWGGVKVNDELQTTNPDIYAAGDVIGGVMLESLAGFEGTVATKNALSDSHKKVDRSTVPQVVFTQPNIARVGKKSENAESRVIKLKELSKAAILGEERGLIKMAVEKESKRILEVQMLGENAGDIINEATLAVKFGLTVDNIIDTVHAFPTMSEALRLVALSFYKDVSKLSCCV
ncbi:MULTISPECIES: mercury(II) reductase [unclassified Stygiolobus]|uniref:mercury(II) reductase n=1 Tax=unclassified Stygiolobus TaxID=2824672 RepID=UPI00307E2599